MFSDRGGRIIKMSLVLKMKILSLVTVPLPGPLSYMPPSPTWIIL